MKQHITLVATLATAAALTACARQEDDELAVAAASQAAGRTAQLSGDMAITAKVNAALVGDDQLKATKINVDTRAGQVTLTGEAPDSQARARATMLASAVDGVKQVNNQLAISPRNG